MPSATTWKGCWVESRRLEVILQQARGIRRVFSRKLTLGMVQGPLYVRILLT